MKDYVSNHSFCRLYFCKTPEGWRFFVDCKFRLRYRLSQTSVPYTTRQIAENKAEEFLRYSKGPPSTDLLRRLGSYFENEKYDEKHAGRWQ